MTAATEKMIQAIEYVVNPLSIGTNLALFHLLWAMVSGAFLSSRGAVHTALKLSGRTDEETRRGGAALRKGQWQIGELLSRWQEWVLSHGGWQRREYEGWYAVSCDVVVFPRLKLTGWVGKLYRGTFGKAVKAVGFGVIVDVGHYEGERVPLLRQIIRCKNAKDSEQQLKAELLQAGAKALGERGVFVHDAGVKVNEVQDAGVERFVIRLQKNCVARQPFLPQKAHGNQKYGAQVRPLARYRKKKLIPSTDDPTEVTSFQHEGRTIQVQCWRGVVGDNVKVEEASAEKQYDIWVFLTHGTKAPLSLRLTSMRQMKQFFDCTWTAGLLSRFHWLQNKWWDCIDSLCLSWRVVGGCPNWRCWLATC